jgi:hypothetical protein
MASVFCYGGFSIRLFTAWQPAYPRVRDLREKKAKGTIYYNLTSRVTFYQSY